MPDYIWVGTIEFAAAMGKSRMWATRGIRSGLFRDAGISVLCVPSRYGRGGRQYFFHVPLTLITPTACAAAA